jgi:hypothetical protein
MHTSSCSAEHAAVVPPSSPSVWLCVVRVLQVQRPGVEPLIFRDIFIFRTLGSFINGW